MENFDIIYEFRLLAKKLQQDDRIVYLDQVRKKLDMDQELQDQIQKFNALQYEYRIESAKEVKDEAKLQNINKEIVSLYADIMANEFMVEYNECKDEVDKLTTLVQAIITAAINGGDPMIVEVPEGGCTGSCSSCSGCGI
ncbi:MAG: YlbF family regulator [Oscillospiraceae bacterium]|nr:YlbF family regulator [Oscillospiraceae bacterium]